MNNILFSFVLPVYNRQGSILKAVDSIINQQYQNWELIIVNDASTDNTAKIIDSIKHDKIRVIHNVVNKERCVSRNIGIAAAYGQYVCFLDSDDYHLPNHLTLIHKAICAKDEEEIFFFTNAWNESENGIRAPRYCPDFENYDRATYFLNYTVNPQRWCVSKSILNKIQFDPSVTICEDMDTSLRLARAGYPIVQVKEMTTVYVAAPDSFTHGDPNKAQKEFFYLKRIFSKPELKGFLPLVPRRRLLSMCHFHMAVKKQQERKIADMYYHLVSSFVLYPPGYNGKTNLPMLVMALYDLPLLGSIIKSVFKSLKRS